MKRVKENLDILKVLSLGKKPIKKAILEKADCELVTCLCECALNCIKGNVKILKKNVNVAKEILKQSRLPSPSIALDAGFVNESLSELKTEEKANEAGALRDQFAQMTKDFKSPNSAVFQMPQTPAAITKTPG